MIWADSHRLDRMWQCIGQCMALRHNLVVALNVEAVAAEREAAVTAIAEQFSALLYVTATLLGGDL